MIVGWIRTSINPQVRSTVSHVAYASKLWKSLKQRFLVKNPVRKHLLEDEITNCKQNGQSVLDYYSRLSKLWKEIQNFKPFVSCTCAAAAGLGKEREDAKVHKFLFGLNEVRFNAIRSQSIDEDPLPDLNIVYSRVIRAEQNTCEPLIQSKTQWGFQSKQIYLHLLLLPQLLCLEAVILTVLAHIVSVQVMKLRSVFSYMVIRIGSLNNNNSTTLLGTSLETGVAVVDLLTPVVVDVVASILHLLLSMLQYLHLRMIRSQP